MLRVAVNPGYDASGPTSTLAWHNVNTCVIINPGSVEELEVLPVEIEIGLGCCKGLGHSSKEIQGLRFTSGALDSLLQRI